MAVLFLLSPSASLYRSTMMLPAVVGLFLLLLMIQPGLVHCQVHSLEKGGENLPQSPPPPSSSSSNNDFLNDGWEWLKTSIGIWKQDEPPHQDMDNDDEAATDKWLKSSQEFEEDLFTERGLISEKVGSIWESTGETRTFVALKFSSFTGILPQSELMPADSGRKTNMTESSNNDGHLHSAHLRATEQMIVCSSLNTTYKEFVEISRQLGKKKNLFNYLNSQEVLDKQLEQAYKYMTTTCKETGRRNNEVLKKFREELLNNGLSYRLKSAGWGGEPDEDEDEELEYEDDNEDDDLEAVKDRKNETTAENRNNKSSKQRMIENIDQNTGIRPREVLFISDFLFAVGRITKRIVEFFVGEADVDRWKDLGTYHDFAGWERNFLTNVQKTAEVSTEIFDRLLEEIFYKHTLNRAFFDGGYEPTLEYKKEKVRKFYRKLLDEYHFKDTVYDIHPLEALKLLRVHPIQWDNKEQALIVEVIAPTYRTQNEPEDLYDVQHIGTLLRPPTAQNDMKPAEGYRRIKFPPMIAVPSFGAGAASRLALYLSSRPISIEMYEAVCIKMASNVYCPALSSFKPGCNMEDITGCDYEDVNFVDYQNRAKRPYYSVHHLNSMVKVARANCPGKTALEWQAQNFRINVDSINNDNNVKPSYNVINQKRRREKRHSGSGGKFSNLDDIWSSFAITENIFKIRVPKGTRLRVCGKIVFKGRDNLISASAAPVKLSKLYKKIHTEAAQKLQINTTALLARNYRLAASQNGTRLDGIGGFGLSRISRAGTGFIASAVNSVIAGPIAVLESLVSWILYAGGILILFVIAIIVALKLIWVSVRHSVPAKCLLMVNSLRKTAMRNTGKLINETKQRLRSMKYHQAFMLEKVLPAKVTNVMLKTMENGYNAAATARNEALNSIEMDLHGTLNNGVTAAPTNMYPGGEGGGGGGGGKVGTLDLDGTGNKKDMRLLNLIRILKYVDLNAYLTYLRKPELRRAIKAKCKKRIRAAGRKCKRFASQLRLGQLKKVRLVEPSVFYQQHDEGDEDKASDAARQQQQEMRKRKREPSENGEMEMDSEDDDNTSMLTDRSIDSLPYEELDWWGDLPPDLLESSNADLESRSNERGE